MKDIIVVGCGISGLATGLLLKLEGFNVTIVAKELPPNTTSDKAAAFWSPYYANGNRVARWAKESLRDRKSNTSSGQTRSRKHYLLRDLAAVKICYPAGRLRRLPAQTKS